MEIIWVGVLMGDLPDYLRCWDQNVVSCDFYMTDDCPETCGYAEEIRGWGIGAITHDLGKGLEKEIQDEE